MQEGGLPGSRLLGGVAGMAGIDARPLILAFAICAGAAAYFSLSFEVDPRLALSAALCTFMLWLAARRWWTSDLAITLVVAAFGLSLGMVAAVNRARAVAAPVVSSTLAPAMVEGWVQDVEPGRNGVRLMIRVHSVSGLAKSEWPVFVRLTHSSRLEVSSGRFVRCWSVLRPPPGPAMPGEYDFRRQAWFAQLGAVGYVQGRCRGGSVGTHPAPSVQAQLWLGAQRRILAEEVHEAAGPKAGGFAAALISGDRSFMSEADTDALRASGLFHIVSISGLHLSILGGLVFLLVKRTLVFIEPLALRIAVQKPAAIAAILACLSYLIISGSAVETQRSFIMAAIVFGAVIFDRSAISLRTFAIAMIAVVLLQPESVVTPGFQMSFAATGALIAAFEVWRNRRSNSDQVLGPIAFSWASVLMTSVVAGLATLPFALYHFDRASPIGFIANLAATPVITFLSAPAAAAAFLLAPFGQSEIGLRLLGYSLELVLWIAHFFAQFSDDPVPSGHAMPVSALLMATLALAAGIAASGPARYLLGGMLMAGALLLWALSPRLLAHWSASGDAFIADGEAGIIRISLADGDGLPPLRFADIEPGACSADVCAYSGSRGISVHVTTGVTPSVCFEEKTASFTDGVPDCLPDEKDTLVAWTWPETAAQGGVTAYASWAGIQLAESRPCGVRPWYPCSPYKAE